MNAGRRTWHRDHDPERGGPNPYYLRSSCGGFTICRANVGAGVSYQLWSVPRPDPERRIKAAVHGARDARAATIVRTVNLPDATDEAARGEALAGLKREADTHG